WQSQLRFYWDAESDGLLARQGTAVVPYGLEYEGAAARLVVTPLTERCWMTLTGALDLCLGANPLGPAATGKTESTKDLARGLATLCVVHNCSSQMNGRMIGRLLSGLAQQGAWACLDEFNRIDVEVLSVVAQQLSLLRHARLAGAGALVFEGREIPLREHHVVATMNPGYAGRAELPNNLKACFRPVAMMVPDFARVAEIVLVGEGFKDAAALSRKATALATLAGQQLSPQPHYDFGMRAIKGMLATAGRLRRGQAAEAAEAAARAAAKAATGIASDSIFITSRNAGVAAATAAVGTNAAASVATPAAASADPIDEEATLVVALCASTLPKLVDSDRELFEVILGDLFPGRPLPNLAHSELRSVLGVPDSQGFGSDGNTVALAAMVAVAATGRVPNLKPFRYEPGPDEAPGPLRASPTQVVKVEQLHDTLRARFGVALVGPAGGGKSTVLRLLAGASTALAVAAATAAEAATACAVVVSAPVSIGDDAASVTAAGGFMDGGDSSSKPVPAGGPWRVVEIDVLNPKALTVGELYGQCCSLTNEWKDGVAAAIIRRAVMGGSITAFNSRAGDAATSTRPKGVPGPPATPSTAWGSDERCGSGSGGGSFPPPVQRWVVFDGPVDAVWVESLNTVLDDSRMLCLANGERIRLGGGSGGGGGG
ncbi:unnamed protein product, partial [Phaeothamnion confervicola]